MVPRAEVTAVDRYVSIRNLLAFFKYWFFKILVYKGNLDNVVGYVHAFDLFKKPKIFVRSHIQLNLYQNRC
ncbi:MAG: hypothetical protein CM15mP83_4750 [Flavobacteriaceae bacterium]|nr:MAG: hypothetical protein CM15mP83_4750 [Flavobacteriaceae bacterium]